MFNAKQFKTILNNIKQMIISNHHITMNSKEISDSLIHTAPRSVSLVHHNFRNDGKGSFQNILFVFLFLKGNNKIITFANTT